ncbi:TPA: peptide deformylase [Candidatus Peribacteria bacterium]|nr:peptide deformylase [Candidatus Peribacteria bacterium]HAS34458.1 peptide deformylase [Candidatus Peribacteria bacterium]
MQPPLVIATIAPLYRHFAFYIFRFAFLSVFPILTGSDNPVLRRKVTNVTKVTKETLQLIKNLETTLRHVGGLGLAAPQIGVSSSVCIARFAGKLHTLINPSITWKSEETDFADEGCLSLPDLTVTVERPTKITVKYLDARGRPQERRLTGWDARVVQHETDHLRNILICDFPQISGTAVHVLPSSAEVV